MKIPVTHGWLEATLREPDEAPRGAAVLCHPHPVFGGSMHTKAVYRAAQALDDAGLVALRFNFRGVGTSTGSHDQGIGERDDARAALDWLADRYPTLPLVLGGFSFGSVVGLSVGVEDERVVAMLGLGLPVARQEYDFSFLEGVDKPTLVVQGEEDEFGSGAQVAAVLRSMSPNITLVRIPGSDHYFTDRLDELRETVRGYFASGPGARHLAGL
ncbi:MAG TPA: alpha/beta family hydrolase [Longimicrobiales bacterium]|nr:alpha/beta family hydrolase [Longimicrobiales bacterium]